ncbi:hypothetical protein BO78DRAFT_400582 [Aspergillus sclerotiicarbonarius CBS 121057]|uniref:Uncharacterized protein n=1 Tax=Aspergillus sclerotiicarbonarius (strain CBS 121057 / IBT 28362) TaxID=1448318 RepID=A0A319E2B8_ASPSB|nr:hypothetical protein BO78DRAFT_400582 [Aspergillus sclerotiicarbonarius CBS 121057]
MHPSHYTASDDTVDKIALERARLRAQSCYSRGIFSPRLSEDTTTTTTPHYIARRAISEY